jgi:hypothetical protein
MVANNNVKEILIGHLRELHLPTFRECFEDAAGRAQQETLSYEQYLLELAERECEVRRGNRIDRLLRQSKLPLGRCWMVGSLTDQRTCWRSAKVAAARRIS